MKLNAAKLGNSADPVKNNTAGTAADDSAAECSMVGDLVQTSTVDRLPESTIHTNYDMLSAAVSETRILSDNL